MLDIGFYINHCWRIDTQNKHGKSEKKSMLLTPCLLNWVPGSIADIFFFCAMYHCKGCYVKYVPAQHWYPFGDHQKEDPRRLL